ncbi:MAG TPA: hypothetical protein VHD63_03530 [Ktedonobacteraceae bacterium]|nr:hypothetical protein [Ktedonobacteraceae bacterium]
MYVPAPPLTSAFANTLQNALRPLMLLVLLRLAIGPLRVRELLPATAKICLATGAMVAVIIGLEHLISLSSWLAQHQRLNQLLTVGGVGSLAIMVYLSLVGLLKVEEMSLLRKALAQKFWPGKSL